MGFLDAQLAQGYAMNYSQRAGLIDQNQKDSYNSIVNGLQMAENILGLGMKTRSFRTPQAARPGEYMSNQAGEIRSRIAEYTRSAGRFQIKLTFRANRLMSREQRYKRDVGDRSNRKVPKSELDSWEIRTAVGRVARRAILRRIILRSIAEEIVKSIISSWWRRPDLIKWRFGGRNRSIKILKNFKKVRELSRTWRTLSKAARASKVGRLARRFASL